MQGIVDKYLINFNVIAAAAAGATSEADAEPNTNNSNAHAAAALPIAIINALIQPAAKGSEANEAVVFIFAKIDGAPPPSPPRICRATLRALAHNFFMEGSVAGLSL